MSTTTRTVHGTPEAVFDVLADGWSYSQWVVGASRVRDVTTRVAAPWEARIHHSVGAWPLLMRRHDDGAALESGRTCSRLTVRAWPSGEGVVRITCPRERGEGTEVTMEEDATKAARGCSSRRRCGISCCSTGATGRRCGAWRSSSSAPSPTLPDGSGGFGVGG